MLQYGIEEISPRALCRLRIPHNAIQCGSSQRSPPRLCPQPHSRTAAQPRGHGLRQQSLCHVTPSCPAGRKISRGAGQGSAQHIVSEAVQLDSSAARWRKMDGCQLLLQGQILIKHSKSECKLDQEQFLYFLIFLLPI